MELHKSKAPAQGKSICDCCNRLVDARTARCHRRMEAPVHVKATNVFEKELISRVPQLPNHGQTLSILNTRMPPIVHTPANDVDVVMDLFAPASPPEMSMMDLCEEFPARTLTDDALQCIGDDFGHNLWIEDETESEDNGDQEKDQEDGDGSESGSGTIGDDADEPDNELYGGLSAWDALGENFEHELDQIGEHCVVLDIAFTYLLTSQIITLVRWTRKLFACSHTK
jgi:hypothetical protein